MYKISDYLTRGIKLLNNQFFPAHKRLSTIMLYSTDRCNSKCKHCYIWEKKPKQHLPFEKIKEIIESPVVDRNTLIGLEGGEFILHPEAEQILEYMVKKHPNFDLLSNAIQLDKLVYFTSKYKPKRLYISLDGDRATYENLRGVDAYNKVIEAIIKLKDIVPVSIMFTLTNHNDFSDLLHVADFCKTHNLDMRIGIYNTMDYFDTNTQEQGSDSLNYDIKDIPNVVKDFKENYDFMALYPEHRSGNLKLSCNSISDSIVIYPNGDVPICQNKQIILGNIFKESLKQVVNKKSTIKLHKEYKHNCNECWVNYHRKYDIVLFRNLEKLLPKRVVELFFGKYYWCENKNKKYKDIVKE
ncbi:MAG: radical SAM protein [Bacteroidales bacterium]|nr:radical SAM protein [Bacteroidales bacterium]